MRRTNMWKRYGAVLLAVLLTFSMAACGGPAQEAGTQPENQKSGEHQPGDQRSEDQKNLSGESENDGRGEADQYGGDLKITVFNTFNNVGYPIGGGGQQKWCSQPAIELLGRYNAEGGVDPWLAESIQPDPDNLKLVITLKQGIKYHDGSDFNAQAVCDVWQIYEDNGNVNALFKAVDSFSATGEYEVTVNLNKWETSVVSNMCIEAGYMISPKTYNEIGLEALYTNIVGTGPYKMESYDITSGIVYTKNENYWREGEPYLDSIEMIFYTEVSTGENIFRSNDANMMYGAPLDSISNMASEGYELLYNQSCLSPTLNGIFFASGNEEDPISDLRVRQAFCHAINKQGLIDAFTYGYGFEMAQIAVPGTKEYNPDVAGYEYNVEKAKALLTEAGYDEGECEITFYYQPSEENMYVAIKAMLEEAGFSVVGDTRTGSENRIIVGTSDPYTCCCIFYAPTTIDNWYRYFSATPFTYAVNTIDMEEAGIIDVYDQCMSAKTEEEQHEAMMKLQELVTENCLYCPLYCTPVFIMIHDGTVQDSGMGQEWHAQWTPERIWMTK